MAATVTLTVNVEQAKAALNQVNTAITQIQLNGSQITIGGQKVASQMNQVAQSTQNVSKSVKQTGRTTQQEIRNITKGFNSITGASSSALASVKNFAKGMVSWWTALVIAVELAAKTFTYFFTNLTQSTDKARVRGQSAIKTAQKHLKEVQKRTKESADLIKKLEDLNKLEKLTSDEQRLAINVINKLNKEYGNLGITYDKTTGKIRGLYEAQIRLDERQRKAQANTLREQAQAQRQVVNAALVEAFGRGISLDKYVNGEDFFGIAERLGGTLGAQNADILARKWNTGDIQKQIQVLEQLIGGLSSSDQVVKKSPEALAALETLKDYKKQLEELNSVSNLVIEADLRLAESFKAQREAIDSTREAIEKLNQSYADQQRANSLASLEPEDRANALRSEVEQLEKRNKLLDKAIQLGQKETDNATANSSTSEQVLQRSRKNLEGLEKQIKDKQKELDDQNELVSKASVKTQQVRPQGALQWLFLDTKKLEQMERADNALTEAEKKRNALSKQLFDLQQSLKKSKDETKQLQIEYQNAQTDTLKHEQAIATLEEQRQKNLNEIQKKEHQIEQINKQIEEARRKAEEERVTGLQKQQEAVENITSSLEKQLEDINKTDLEKKIESALDSAQKAKGADLTQDQVDRITFLVTQLQKMNQLQKERKTIKQQQEAIENLFKGYEESQTIAMLNLIGKQKQALILEARLNAQRAKGAALTEQEYQSLVKYVEQQIAINEAENFNPNISHQGQNVITNDLASKGGWASSIVVDRAKDYNKEILAVQNKQYDLQNQIKNSIEKYGVIQ